MPVSEVVATALFERMRRLDYAERIVLMRAAVIGQRFRFAVLASTAPLTDDTVRAALDTVCSLEFIVRDDTPADSYTFRHALIREVAYAECVADVLRPIHKKIARALERHFEIDDGALGDLAYHAWAAGDAKRSIRYNELAGDRALIAFARDEAHTFYERGRAFASRSSHHYRRLARKLDALVNDTPNNPGGESEERQSSGQRDCSTRSLPAVRWTPR